MEESIQFVSLPPVHPLSNPGTEDLVVSLAAGQSKLSRNFLNNSCSKIRNDLVHVGQATSIMAIIDSFHFVPFFSGLAGKYRDFGCFLSHNGTLTKKGTVCPK